MPFTIFQKSVHRKPVLAIYKSLLKLSSSPILGEPLSTRLRYQIRTEFRRNKLWSARLVKHQLIKAFKVIPFPPPFQVLKDF